MKPALVQFIDQQDIEATRVMNLLQEHGICSDNCVTSDEVVEGGKCIAWLAKFDLKPLKKP